MNKSLTYFVFYITLHRCNTCVLTFLVLVFHSIYLEDDCMFLQKKNKPVFHHETETQKQM